jgi:atypical dual specificity phosphatase
LGSGGLFLRKLRARVADEPTGFVWVEQGRLAASGYPASRKQLKWVAARGINVVLTLTEKPLPPELTDGMKMEFVHLSMRDHGVPDPDTMDQGAKLVQTHIGNGKNVLVHCLAGEGRTGCVLAAYLILTRRIGGDEAMTILRDIKPRFVERQQEAAVRSYAEEAKRRPIGS